MYPCPWNFWKHAKCGKTISAPSLNTKYYISNKIMSTSELENSLYILYKIIMEIKYRVPTKSYIYHKLIDPFMDEDINYTSKQITKKHFTFEGPLQKTKYHKK